MKILKNPTFWIVIYLQIIVIYTILFWKLDPSPKVFLTSNELGDFLAGVFAPMAFIFLYLGYKLQSEAIKANNDAILDQLKIQKSMLELQHRERLEREHSAQPIIECYFTIIDAPYQTNRMNNSTGRLYESFVRKIKMNVTNSGAKVSQLNVRCLEPFEKNLAFNRVLDGSGTLECELSIKESILEMHANLDRVNLVIQLNYVTSLGIKYKINFEVEISSLVDDDHLIYSAINNPIKISE